MRASIGRFCFVVVALDALFVGDVAWPGLAVVSRLSFMAAVSSLESRFLDSIVLSMVGSSIHSIIAVRRRGKS